MLSAPSTVTPGQNFSASVTMNNVGTKAWSSPHYWLSAVAEPNNWIERWVPGGGLDMPLSPVNLGQSVTFNMNATAPTASGVYSFGWQMIQDDLDFFGQVCAKNITVASDSNPGVASSAQISAKWASGADMPSGYEKLPLSLNPLQLYTFTLPLPLNSDYIILVNGSGIKPGVVFDLYKSDGITLSNLSITSIPTTLPLDSNCPPPLVKGTPARCYAAFRLSLGSSGAPLGRYLLRARNPDNTVSNYIPVDIMAAGSYVGSKPFIFGIASETGIFGSVLNQNQSHTIDVYGTNFKQGDVAVIQNVCSFPNEQTCGPLNKSIIPVTYLSPAHVQFNWTTTGWGSMPCPSTSCLMRFMFQIVTNSNDAFGNSIIPWSAGNFATVKP